MKTTGKNDKQSKDQGELLRWAIYIANSIPTCFLSKPKLETALNGLVCICKTGRTQVIVKQSCCYKELKASLLHEPFTQLTPNPQALGDCTWGLPHDRHTPYDWTTSQHFFTFYFETRSYICDLFASAPKPVSQVCSSYFLTVRKCETNATAPKQLTGHF